MAVAQTTEGMTVPPQRPLIMRYAARSDVGRIRSKNDDSAYVGRHLAVVADGMGGHAGGDIASASTVLDMIHLDQDQYHGDAGTVLADEIQTANSLLSELVHINPKLAGMGTTVTALLLAEGKLHFAHIGDSRAYRLRKGTFEQISIDHTFVQRLIDEGRLRPEEAETHPHKNVLMRVLGDVDASPELDLATLDVEAGERWLLCSDGLNYVAGHVVERVVRETKDLRECADLLVRLTLEAGAPDNVTVVVLEIAEETYDDVSTDAVEIVAAGATAHADKVTATKAVDATLPLVSATDATPKADAAAMPKAGPVAGTSVTPVPDGQKASGATAPSAAAKHDTDKRDADKHDTDKPDADIPVLPTTPAEVPNGSVRISESETPAGSGSGATEPSNSKGPVGSKEPGDSKEPSTKTDPHLGEHLSAEVLREELASRPHELVGAAAAAAESGSIPTVAGRSVARRAATVLTHKAEQDRMAAEAEAAAPRRRRWVTMAVAAALALFVAAGLWLGYAWTQTRYYIGEYDHRVAIFNGISQRLGPIQLSTLETVTDVSMDSLQEFWQQRVRQTVPAKDLYDAQRIVKNLETTGTTGPEECPPGPSTGTAATTRPPTASPAPTASASPSPASTAGAGSTPTATPTPSPTCEVVR